MQRGHCLITVTPLYEYINEEIKSLRRSISARACGSTVCVTANLGIHAEWRQVMGTSGISGVWRSLKKGVFSKNASFKSYGVIYSPRVAPASFQGS